MRKLTLLTLALLVFSGVALAQLQAPGDDTTPAVGTMAPDYGLDLDSKVLLAFFPAAFTPG